MKRLYNVCIVDINKKVLDKFNVYMTLEQKKVLECEENFIIREVF